MKPARFRYARPATLADALALMAEHGAGARPLAGGQSLAPLLNMRLMRPELVVDLNLVDGLAGIVVDERGTTIGALTRYAELERSPLISEHLPLLAHVMRWIGDRQVRNRGTLGGAIAQADPTGEAVLACLALDATVELQSVRGARAVAVDDLILGPYETAIAPDELLVAVRFRRAPSAFAFAEMGRKHNDFAIASVAAVGSRRPDGSWSRLRIALSGLDERPVVATTPAALLEGGRLDEDDVERAVASALEVSDAPDDVRASAGYRTAVVAELMRRVLRELRADGEIVDV